MSSMKESHSFGRLIWEYRLSRNLKLNELAAMTGVTGQYIHGLENKPGKNPSVSTLRNLAIILSQTKSSINLLKQKLTEYQSSNKDFTEYLVSNQSELYRTAKPSILYNILLAGTELHYFKNKIVFVDNIISEFEITDFIKKNLLDETLMAEIRHDYQVWTLTDIMGEAISEDAARTTAENIVKYKIKYFFFVPIDDDTRWEEGLYKIRNKINELLQLEIYADFWKSLDSTLEFVRIYGLNRTAFFSRFRIYNATSIEAVGNYNVGGITIEEAKFADMPRQILDFITKQLQIVISADNARIFEKENPRYFTELGSNVMQKFPRIQ